MRGERLAAVLGVACGIGVAACSLPWPGDDGVIHSGPYLCLRKKSVLSIKAHGTNDFIDTPPYPNKM
jgi:hypothetical protein